MTLALILGLVAGPTTRARAEEPTEKATCHKAYEQGQRLRRAKKLVESRSQFVQCARDPCPAVFQPECAKWLTEVDNEIPTVVVVIDGIDKGMRASVLVDGRPFADAVDGIARPLDPGIHEVRVRVGAEELVQRATVVEGAKAQRIAFDLPDTRSRAPRPTRRSLSPLAIGVGSLGIAALASFGFFSISGLASRSDVLECTPNCPQSDVDAARRSLLIADVSLGVSAIALGLTTYLYLTSSRPIEKTGLSTWPLRF